MSAASLSLFVIDDDIDEMELNCPDLCLASAPAPARDAAASIPGDGDNEVSPNDKDNDDDKDKDNDDDKDDDIPYVSHVKRVAPGPEDEHPFPYDDRVRIRGNLLDLPLKQWTHESVNQFLCRKWRMSDLDNDPVLAQMTHFRRCGVRCEFEFLCEFQSPKFKRHVRFWVPYTSICVHPEWNRMLRETYQFKIEQQAPYHYEEYDDAPGNSYYVSKYSDTTMASSSSRKRKGRYPCPRLSSKDMETNGKRDVPIRYPKKELRQGGVWITMRDAEGT